MTITIAWTRSVHNTNELLLASDSRLSGGGGYIDICQKVFPLPRGDVGVGFCGTTSRAYPLILQMIGYVNNYAKALARGFDITDMRKVIIEIMNEFRSSYARTIDLDMTDDDDITLFILAGFSWKLGRYCIYTLHFDHGIQRYTFRPAGLWGGQRVATPEHGKRIAVVGDYSLEFREKLRSLLQKRNRISAGGFDMEPFEVLVRMLNSQKYTERRLQGSGLIGGAPQLIKIYKYGSTLPYAVRMKTRGDRFLFGRKLLPFELTTYPIITASTLRTQYPLNNLSN